VNVVAQALRGPNADRYLARVYTEQEISDCKGAGGVDPGRLAGRFAAKEATLKVLSITDEGVSLRDIEVRSDPSGHVSLELHGRAAELAHEAGVIELALSLTHETWFAAAVVVSVADGVPRSPGSADVHRASGHGQT
jgi:holo-[acyl-carrier protein] synthase